MTMDIAITVVLMLLAVLLLVVEVALIPGFGFAGVLGVLLMVTSIFYSFFTLGYVAGWIVVLASVVVCVSLFLWALYGNSLDRLALKKKIDSSVKEGGVEKLKVGDRGVTKTRLALVGEAYFAGETVEVKSEMGMINENEEIEIVRITGGAVFVERVVGK